MIFPTRLTIPAKRLSEKARISGVMIATAESCTGGMIAALLTELPGSSDIFDRGFVTYSYEAKTELLGIPSNILQAHGAVSAEVAQRMAEETLLRSNADIAVSVTGVAGPGGIPHKPAGLVHFGLAARNHSTRCLVKRFGDQGRSNVRQLTTETALQLLSDGVDLFG
jgi:nicotinamide-nucleotide amidase